MILGHQGWPGVGLVLILFEVTSLAFRLGLLRIISAISPRSPCGGARDDGQSAAASRGVRCGRGKRPVGGGLSLKTGVSRWSGM